MNIDDHAPSKKKIINFMDCKINFKDLIMNERFLISIEFSYLTCDPTKSKSSALTGVEVYKSEAPGTRWSRINDDFSGLLTVQVRIVQ